MQIKSFIFGGLLLVHAVAASKYGSSGSGNEGLYQSSNGNGGGSSDGGSQLDLSSLGQLAEFVQSGPSYQSASGTSVPAAIQTRRTIEVKPVNIPQEHIEPHIVDVEATYQPVHVVFRSSSSPVMVQQIHTPAQQAQVDQQDTEDEPHVVRHRVLRPIVQEVREVIQPYRRVLQVRSPENLKPLGPQQDIELILVIFCFLGSSTSSRGGKSHRQGSHILISYSLTHFSPIQVRTIVAKAEGGSYQRGNGAGGSNGAEQVILKNVGGNGGLSGAGHLGSALGAGGAYASASVPAPSYSTRGRRSNVARGEQRKAYRRASAKRQSTVQALYASSL